MDIAFTLLPVDEPDLATGEGLNRVSYQLGVSSRHPLAGRAGIDAEELASLPLIGLDGPAPRAWRERVAPSVTPFGRPIPAAVPGRHQSGRPDPGGAQPGRHAVLRPHGGAHRARTSASSP